MSRRLHHGIFRLLSPRCLNSTTLGYDRALPSLYMHRCRRSQSTSSTTTLPHSPSPNSGTADATGQQIPDYKGPIADTFRRLKIFSLSSLGLSFTLSPFMFVIESNLPGFARAALCATALGTSGISTALVSWCASPYVTELKRLPPGGVRMTTMSMMLKPRVTTVFDDSFLIVTKRPFAKWELAETITLPELDDVPPKDHSGEETIAETVDGEGKVIGRWIVKWEEGGKGTCREAGKVVRYFNVHEELLPP